jgi:hypothetical protein
MATWQKAKLRESLFRLPKGSTVFVIRTKVKHTSVGTTYWVYSVSSSVVYQVAESYGGPELRRILSVEREACNQELLSEKANRLLKPFRVHIQRKA